MSRLIFGNVIEFKKWIQNRMDPNKYECYVTEEREIVLVPTKSTPPIIFGYFKAETVDLMKSPIITLRDLNVQIYRLRRYEWKTDSPVGAVFAAEVD